PLLGTPDAPAAVTAATATTTPTPIARNLMSPPCLEPTRVNHERKHQAHIHPKAHVQAGHAAARLPVRNHGPTRRTPLLVIRKPFPDRTTVHLTPAGWDRQRKRPMVIFLP